MPRKLTTITKFHATKIYGTDGEIWIQSNEAGQVNCDLKTNEGTTKSCDGIFYLLVCGAEMLTKTRMHSNKTTKPIVL